MKHAALAVVLCSLPALAPAHAQTPTPRRASATLSRRVDQTTQLAGRSGEDCTPGYDPCIPPGPDVDCAGGSGNGPRYVEGPVRVTGSDPYGLDRDGDGIACE